MSAVTTDSRAATPWRQALPLLLSLIGLILLAYRETVVAMVGIWSRSDTFAHAFLVPPLSLWLIWRQRRRLATLVPRSQPWVLLALLGAGLVWLLADLVVVNAAAQFAVVTMLVLAVPAVLGLEVAKAMLFPLAFLYFAVPFGEFMLQPMMEWTADFTVAALQLTGIPVYREGLFFVIPSGSWSVIDECSGVRYLIASFMVGTLFAYLNYQSFKRRAIFMAFSIAVPIVANWMRAYIIVMMGHLSNNTLAVGVDHLLYGWVFFGIVIFLMFVVGARWSEPSEIEPESASSVAPGASIGVRSTSSGSPWLVMSLAVALVVCLPQVASWGLQRSQAAAAPATLSLPATLRSGWADRGAQIVEWTPHYLGSSASVTRAYVGPAGTVGVYIAYYRAQGDGRKLVSSQNGFVGINDRLWNVVGTGSKVVGTAAGQVPFRTAEIHGPQASGAARRPKVSAWRVYWVDGRVMTGDVATKLSSAVATLSGRGDDGASLVLFSEGESAAASVAALEAFAKENMAELLEQLARTRDAR